LTSPQTAVKMERMKKDLSVSFTYEEPHHVMCWTRNATGCSFCISFFGLSLIAGDCDCRCFVHRNTSRKCQNVYYKTQQPYKSYNLLAVSRHKAIKLRVSTPLIAHNCSIVRKSEEFSVCLLLQGMVMKQNCEECLDKAVWGSF
jgi:hypothetical protein